MAKTRSQSADRGPRIYNLFPSLAGDIGGWSEQLPRIAAMNFDWVYLNPFHETGASGSLYAVKDPSRLDARFAGKGDPADSGPLESFVADARAQGLRVAMDLVINHSASDSVLVEQHPEWYRRDLDGGLFSPRVADLDDPARVTVWEDLAEFDYEHPVARAALVEHWSAYILVQLRLGIRGFRCDAAYMVPAEIWRELIERARAEEPSATFFAETLGCTVDAVEALTEAGFDYLFNSSKWWDFRGDWLLDQYQRMRAIAPSIAFPESHDTARAALEAGSEDPGTVARYLKLRYLFAACFSTGVMLPIGYEFGFRKPLDVVTSRPGDWEKTGIDLSAYVGAVNALKESLPVLNREGAQRRLSAPGAEPLALLRWDEQGEQESTILLLNPDPADAREIDPGFLMAELGGTSGRFEDVTPEAEPLDFDPAAPLSLAPLEARLFRVSPAGQTKRPRAPSAKSSERQLRALAAERVTIESVWPEIDGGRHGVKRAVGDLMEVWADIFCDGHDVIAACVKYKPMDERDWREAPLGFFDNDRWRGFVPLSRNTRYHYTIEAWRDLFAGWRRDFVKKRDAGLKVSLELTEGRELVERAMEAAQDADRETLAELLATLGAAGKDEGAQAALLLSPEMESAMLRAGPRTNLTRYRNELEVFVARTAARYSAWYEIFPRSMSDDPERHGNFDDVIEHLPYVQDLGFDVLYFPPIHPIGRTNRKGRNNTLTPTPDDPGSPYAIGSEEGAHTAIHPELGTLEDFQRLVAAARGHGLEIALDFAIQCSPDHPWIKQHPGWFDWRPDGSIKFAENPPKKYEDIVNVHFYRDALPSIWYELRDVVLFWIEQGVKIFRVDNPHTKPMPFWEWMIREVQDRHPDAIFLAEAFTRPKVMKKLAKVGFDQSYSYFTWRNTKAELTEYLIELTQGSAREYMQPNFFVNTPDINPVLLQTGGRAAFQFRAILAATLSTAWGLYSGFELCEGTPVVAGKEEYLDSEKYQIRAWDWDRPGNIRETVARLNRIRRDNPALHGFTNLRFHTAWNDNVLFYGKATPRGDSVVWIAVNLDPHNVQEAAIELPLAELGLDDQGRVLAEELLGGESVTWTGRHQHIRLDPQLNPCAIWRVTPNPAS